ncbi:MAG: hypothetical protein U9R79_08415 [Armatimonadota bacterium]|nr:hypothetical protein [Armatimonadota bacterium]
MSGEQRAAERDAGGFDIAGGVIGILVFLAGIAMIIMVFTWVRGVFDGVDEQVQQVRSARAAAAAAQQAATPGEEQPAGGAEAGAPEPGATSASVVATPHQGPTIADVGVTIGLKMLGLLVLGWLGALVASKGAQLAGAHRGKRK